MDQPHGCGVNDFALKIATVNGTGSASANSLLLQALFRMGIPVSGKNVFPSNIQGLPTWYEIRVNKDGYTARSPDFHLMVAMNPESYARDIESVVSGGWIIYDSTKELTEEFRREDVNFIGIPLAQMCIEHFEGSRTRILMKNITYVGALVALLDIDMDVVKGMLEEKFAAKKHLMKSNFEAIARGHDYVKERFDCPLPIRLEAMDENRGKVIVTGNSAAALGCVYAGATVGAWYPITPATSVMDGFAEYCERFRVDASTGKHNYAILQAEDELSAAGMVIGASWMGARAFTPTAGPGISLMSEFIGLAYYSEVPGVFFDIQRTGPSTGMPTRTQQGDLILAAYASHGDTKHIVLFPSDPRECFEFAVKAFDLAERFQTPVFVLSDLDIGMNDWVVDKFEWDDAFRPDRGKVLTADELAKAKNFYRYLDVDGDHIAARSLPGTHPKGAYFTRGSGHDKYGRYTEDSDAYSEVMERLKLKIASAGEAVPAPVIQKASAPTSMGLISLGGCNWAVMEARDDLASRGIHFDYMRVRGFPFGRQVEQFLAEHDMIFVIEQNRDEQLKKLLTIETAVPKEKLHSVTYFGGQPLSKGHVLRGLAPHLEGKLMEVGS
ncbi:MAG: 2-oxoacid:acceptor oxidoreductase subunit alpha [Longimicrobiales bacterium]